MDENHVRGNGNRSNCLLNSFRQAVRTNRRAWDNVGRFRDYVSRTPRRGVDMLRNQIDARRRLDMVRNQIDARRRLDMVRDQVGARTDTHLLNYLMNSVESGLFRQNLNDPTIGRPKQFVSGEFNPETGSYVNIVDGDAGVGSSLDGLIEGMNQHQGDVDLIPDEEYYSSGQIPPWRLGRNKRKRKRKRKRTKHNYKTKNCRTRQRDLTKNRRTKQSYRNM